MKIGTPLPPPAFAAALDRWNAKVRQCSTAVAFNVANAMKDSITDGSPLTGAPGQPVDTGYLKTSWVLEPRGRLRYVIGTNVAYAPVIEENRRDAYDKRGKLPPRLYVLGVRGRYVLRPGRGRSGKKSTVGGHHSVMLTRVNFNRLALAVTRRTVATYP